MSIHVYLFLIFSNGIACPHKIGEDKICFDIRVFELSEDSQDSRLPKEMFPRIVILEPLSGTSGTLESELAARCSNVLVKQTCKNKKQDWPIDLIVLVCNSVSGLWLEKLWIKKKCFFECEHLMCFVGFQRTLSRVQIRSRVCVCLMLTCPCLL